MGGGGALKGSTCTGYLPPGLLLLPLQLLVLLEVRLQLLPLLLSLSLLHLYLGHLRCKESINIIIIIIDNCNIMLFNALQYV